MGGVKTKITSALLHIPLPMNNTKAMQREILTTNWQCPTSLKTQYPIDIYQGFRYPDQREARSIVNPPNHVYGKIKFYLDPGGGGDERKQPNCKKFLHNE